MPDFFQQLISIWEGGLIWYGAVIGGLLTYAVSYWFVFRKQGVVTLKLFDVLAPTIAVGLCIGRIGCFLNGCCFGMVACPDCAAVGVPFPLSAPARFELVKDGYQTAAGFTVVNPVKVDRVAPDSPAARAGLASNAMIGSVNGKEVDFDSRDPVGDALSMGRWPRGQNELKLTTLGGIDQEPKTVEFHPWTLPLHPTQIYESISMVLLFLVLTAYFPFRRRDGQVVAVLMAGYALHRYLNELLRADARPVGFESWTSVVLFFAGVGLWLWLQSRPPQYRIAVPPADVARAGAASTAFRPARA
jgi:phosphatidylglycerol:prolipoprotein diacylglycerol transferase